MNRGDNMTHPIDIALTHLILCIDMYHAINMSPPTKELITEFAKEYKVSALDLEWSYVDYECGLLKLKGH